MSPRVRSRRGRPQEPAVARRRPRRGRARRRARRHTQPGNHVRNDKHTNDISLHYCNF